MKTKLTTELSEYSYIIPSVTFARLVSGKVVMESIRIELTSTEPFVVRELFNPGDWLKLMLHNRLVITPDIDSDKFDHFEETLIVESIEMDYILLSLLRILQKLSTDVNILSISYEKL